MMPESGPSEGAHHVQIIGICRFSVPSLGAFQGVPEDIGARRAALYDPARLNHRMVWFEHILLPSIRAQTDPDFTLVLLLGEDFPQPWAATLLSLVEALPQVVVHYAPPAGHREICANAMRPHISRSAARVAQFRLDDDDAVAVDFVGRLRHDVMMAEPMLKRQPLMAFDYARGLVLRETPDKVTVEPCITQCWAPALALVLPWRRDRYVLDYPHHMVWRRMPLMSQPDPIMFVRGAHGGNDSAIRVQERGFAVSPQEVPKLLSTRFGIDLAGFEAALAGL